MVERERVETDRAGAADFVFLNRSQLLVGPGCNVTLDHRYYDRRLDVEVKEYRMTARRRCVVKADNFNARSPEDRIVLRSARGTVVVAQARANILLEGDEPVGGLPEGREGQTMLRVSAPQVGDYVSLHETGQAIGRGSPGAVMTVPGTYSYITSDGSVHGPEREMIVNLDALMAVSTPQVSDYRPTRLLTPLRTTQRIRRITAGPPATCRGGVCGRIPQRVAVEPPPPPEPPTEVPPGFSTEVSLAEGD